MEVKVSIIITNYNHELFLKQRIESVLNQTFQDFEIIIFDDASTDNSFDYLKKFKNHSKVSHLITSNKNLGNPFMYWRQGIKLAKGDYIWIAESDDFSSTLFLSKVMEAFMHFSKPDVVFAGTTNINEFNEDIGNNSRIEKKYKSLLSRDFSIKGFEFLEFFLPNYCVIRNMSSAVFKKSAINLKKFNIENYSVIGDYYFWMNLCSQNHSFYYVSERLNFMRNHTNTIRNNKKLIHKKGKEFIMIHKELVLRNFTNFKVYPILARYYFKKKIFKA